MQTIIEEIFAKLGGATAIARGAGHPVQTVHDWLAKGTPEIPPWRRASILDLARRTDKLAELSPDAREYLTSTNRPARKAKAA